MVWSDSGWDRSAAEMEQMRCKSCIIPRALVNLNRVLGSVLGSTRLSTYEKYGVRLAPIASPELFLERSYN